jgi:leucyl aminopeptidase (aminopeptidase T)
MPLIFGRNNNMNISQAVFQQCFNVQPQESILIVMDQGKLAEAEELRRAALTLTQQVQMIEIVGMSENAQEPSANITQALLAADVAVLVTTFSLSHTRARQAANNLGVRIASLPGITLEILNRTLSSDYREIARLSQQLADELTGAKQVTLTSPAGTELTFSVMGQTALADTGNLTFPGAFGNLPAGEAFVAPVSGSTNGKLVIDGCLADIQLDAPITVNIVDGVVSSITGGQAAAELLLAMTRVGDKAKIVAEFGIGTNPKAIVTSDVLEAEKVYGTCHIAFGDNASFGGTNDVAFHSDGVILNPTLELDGRPVLTGGVFI